MGLNQSIKMCLASCFAVSGGLVAIGILEQFDTPLTRTTCFTGYTDCSNELRIHNYPFIPYIVFGIGLIFISYVTLHYNKVFNKVEVDK